MAQRHGCGLGSVGLGDSKGDSVTRVNLRGDNGEELWIEKCKEPEGEGLGICFSFCR